MSGPAHLLDSITDAGAGVEGGIVISGSHGGLYPAAVASRAGIRAVVVNDAGIGLDNAGVAGVLKLADYGMAAAAVDCQSCRIGSAEDALHRGRISAANALAATVGVEVGMGVAEAAELLNSAPSPIRLMPPVTEARQERVLASGISVVLVDSASLVGPEDEGKIVITGSHGGLIGGDPNRALKARARIAVFNDAGFGADGVGVSRLPALDARGVAAVTVSCQSARIGDASSALETGVISRGNTSATQAGARVGERLIVWLESLRAG